MLIVKEVWLNYRKSEVIWELKIENWKLFCVIINPMNFVKKILEHNPDLTIKDNMDFTPDYYTSLNKYPKYDFQDFFCQKNH